jgi:PAS domain S-box-containing protein
MLRAPLRSRGALVGLIDLARAAGQPPFSQSDLDLVRDLSDRCALALDNALLLEAHSEASEQLVKFQALADASDDLIGISEPLGGIVYVNPAVHELGIALAAGDVWATIAPYVRRSQVAAIRDCLATTGRWSGDLTVTAGEETRVGHLDVFELAHPGTGAGLGAAWIGRDVTELRATEAALRATNADMKQFMALVEASPDFIAIAGLDGQVRYVNPNGRRLVGLPPDRDVTTTTIPDYLTPEGLEASMKVEQPAVIANGHWEGESTLRGPDGGPIPVAIASFLVRDPQTGEPFALATVQRDISDRIASEQALRDLAEQRQALLSRLVDAQDAERSQIAADVHDDPVQALAAVDLRLGLLRRKLRERAPDLLDTLEPLQASVSGATDRLRALLFDLEPPDLQHGLATALGRAAEEMFEHTDTHWAVEADAEPELPDATRAIAYRVGKEAMNNVRKHAHADQVTITVNGVRGGVELTVTDDGVGLPTDPLQSLPGHRGIFNMQDRAAVAGGSCTVVRGAHGGTEVRVWLPGQGTPAA